MRHENASVGEWASQATSGETLRPEEVAKVRFSEQKETPET